MTQIRKEQINSGSATDGHVLTADGAGNCAWEAPTAGSGVDEFIELTDTPAAYTDQAGKYLKVNSSETGLEFVTLSGGGDMAKATYDTDDDGSVDKADAIDGVAAAGNSKYYGTDGSGTPGFHSLPAGGGGISITWASATTTAGQDYDRATSGTFDRLVGRLTLLRPLKITAVLWDVRNAGTYTLYLAQGGPSDTAIQNLVVDQVVAAGGEITFDLSAAPVMLFPGVYYLGLKKSDGATTWWDNNLDETNNALFVNDYVWYNTTGYGVYTLPIKLTAYIGTLNLV